MSEHKAAKAVGLYREGMWIETYTGKHVNPLELQPDDICIDDIAHHLSLLCRFNGACRQFYSVAQHSVHVAELVPDQYKLEALLHDAAEAYMSDVTRPVKYSIATLKILDDMISAKIMQKFGVKQTYESKLAVKEADDIMLATEARDLMCSRGAEWYLPYPPKLWIVVPQTPVKAESMFLDQAWKCSGLV